MIKQIKKFIDDMDESLLNAYYGVNNRRKMNKKVKMPTQKQWDKMTREQKIKSNQSRGCSF